MLYLCNRFVKYISAEFSALQPASGTELAVPGKVELPTYFEPQVEKAYELAKGRQEVARKRLANFRPTYPETESQLEALSHLVIGVHGEDATVWLSVDLDKEKNAANIGDVPETILGLLERGDLISVIRQGYNILTFAPLEQLSIEDLLSEAIRKHFLKYGGDVSLS